MLNVTVAIDTAGCIYPQTDSTSAMEESLIQQHLSHYKQATETAREELAALQVKYQSLQSQVHILTS